MPLLPIRSYRDFAETVAYVNLRPRPLATHDFRRDRAEQGLNLERRHLILDAATARSMTGGVRHDRVDIPGYQFSPVQRWLRNDNGYRARRRLKRLAARYRQGRVARDTVRQSVASWLGHAHHADCDALLEQILAGVVFQRM